MTVTDELPTSRAVGKQRVFALDVEFAENFLRSLPLLGTGWDSQREPHWFERQNSGASADEYSEPDCGAVYAGKYAPRFGTAPHEKLHEETLVLDVHRASRFLRSLEVVPMPDCQNPVEERRLVGDVSDRVRGFSSDPYSLGDHHDDNIGKHDRCAETIVTGGWRNRTDLDRLAPGLIRKGLIGGRIIVSAQQSVLYISSTLPLDTVGFTSALLQGTRKSMSPSDAGLLARFARVLWRLADMLRDNYWHWGFSSDQQPQLLKGTSFAEHLSPRGEKDSYDPNFLDDQSLRQGKNHTVLQLESYQVSVLPFLRPRRLKEELNDQFRVSHPDIHPSITLSKLRNLQKDLREIAVDVDELDFSTVAMAWAYFEQLVLGGRVLKVNRKLLAGACLVLAFKFHQQGDRAILKRLVSSIRALDRKDRLNIEDVHDAELHVFVWLKFGLHLHAESVMPHLHRSLKDLGCGFDEYYGSIEWLA